MSSRPCATTARITSRACSGTLNSCTAATTACWMLRRCSRNFFRRPVKILNPADGSLLRDLADDGAQAIAAKYAAARKAQPAWAATPLEKRLTTILRFKQLVE